VTRGRSRSGLKKDRRGEWVPGAKGNFLGQTKSILKFGGVHLGVRSVGKEDKTKVR